MRSLVKGAISEPYRPNHSAMPASQLGPPRFPKPFIRAPRNKMSYVIHNYVAQSFRITHAACQ